MTLKYFGDLECPICKEFTLSVLPTLIPKYVRTGKLKIEYHSLETATREPEVFKTQQVAAYAAGKQNLGWYFIETFYHEQGEEDSGYVNENYLQGIASQVPGLNLADWTAARSEPTYANEVDRRRAGRQPGRLHRHALVPARQDRRHARRSSNRASFTEAGAVRSGHRKAAEELARAGSGGQGRP